MAIDQEWDTLYAAVVADVLDQLGYRNQTLGAEIRALTPANRVCGRAFTARVENVDAIPAEPYKLEMEPSDNIGAGAPGDGTGCLRALFAHAIGNAAIAIHDPEAVAALAKCAPGERRTLRIGGKGSRIDEGPLDLEVELVHLDAQSIPPAAWARPGRGGG